MKRRFRQMCFSIFTPSTSRPVKVGEVHVLFVCSKYCYCTEGILTGPALVQSHIYKFVVNMILAGHWIPGMYLVVVRFITLNSILSSLPMCVRLWSQGFSQSLILILFGERWHYPIHIFLAYCNDTSYIFVFFLVLNFLSRYFEMSLELVLQETQLILWATRCLHLVVLGAWITVVSYSFVTHSSAWKGWFFQSHPFCLVFFFRSGR